MRLASIGFAHTSMLCTRMEPAVGRSKPVIIERVVVLPAPLGPTIPKKDPARTSRLMSATATFCPKRLVSPDTASTTGAGALAGAGFLAIGARGVRFASGRVGPAAFARTAASAGVRGDAGLRTVDLRTIALRTVVLPTARGFSGGCDADTASVVVPPCVVDPTADSCPRFVCSSGSEFGGTEVTSLTYQGRSDTVESARNHGALGTKRPHEASRNGHIRMLSLPPIGV